MSDSIYSAHETEAFALDANRSGEDWADFARRLERERDEWKTKAILHGNAALELESECFAMVTFARRLEQERDEARRELKLEQSRVWAAMLTIQKSDDERDSLRARVADLEADYKELARHHNMECTCLEIY